MSETIASTAELYQQTSLTENVSYSDTNQIIQELYGIKFALDQAAIVAITDRAGKIIAVNQKFCELSKYSREELIGRDHRIINSGYHPKGYFQKLWQALDRGEVWKGEICNRAKDGSLYWVDTTILPQLDANGRPIRYLAIRFDITARKQSEENLQATLSELQQTQLQLIQSEQLSSIGQLVAGIAHEINNPVNFIYGNLIHLADYTHVLLQATELYQAHYPKNPDIEAELEAMDFEFVVADLDKLQASMKMGAERIRQIVLSLRNFSRHDEAEMKAVDLHEGIDNTLILLGHRLKAQIERPEVCIHRHYSHLPPVECYASRLNQVFMNLLGNAVDAIEMRYGAMSAAERKTFTGTIAIETALTADDRVTIRITDNGGGIPEAVQRSIFHPFFTTKDVGKGTGLGLSISRQIVVEQHGGRLDCESAVGEGTCFAIAIPLSRSPRTETHAD